MKSQKRINEIYRDLLAKLGELGIQKELIEKDMDAIKGRIEGLNIVAPEMQKIEKELKEDKIQE